jgi:maltooligosyltrehalose trehalohydrolase
LNGHRFLGYLQNHDQIGNRAQGDRSSQLMSAGRLKIGAALVLTSPFVPMLFQGEEWAASTPFLFFTNHQDPELASTVDEGRCREFAAFNWDPASVPHPQDPQTFARSKLNWTELAGQRHKEMLEWHRQLIRLRHAEPALSDGRLDLIKTRFDETAGWLVVERQEISVACNLGKDLQHVPLRAGKHSIVLASEPRVSVGEGSVFLPPESVAILK